MSALASDAAAEEDFSEIPESSKTPVTLVTGFLGWYSHRRLCRVPRFFNLVRHKNSYFRIWKNYSGQLYIERAEQVENLCSGE